MIGIPFVLVTNLGNIRSKLPIFNKKTTKSTLLGAFVTFIIMIIGFSMVGNFKSPEQKQLDLLASKQAAGQAEIKAEDKKIASNLNGKVVALGDVNALTYDKEKDVISIRKEYEALTPEQKRLVTNLVLLESAEKRITDLKAIADKEAEKKAAEDKAVADKKAAEAKAAADKKVAEEKAAKDYQSWISNQFSAWDGSNTHLVKLIKEHLNDPKSYQHVETVYWDKGTYILVKMTYRAKNAFGALILQNVTAKVDYVSQIISIVSQND